MRGNAMNLLEVGELLRRERERCGITIRDVMEATKISRRNLTALEEGQVKSLPHPVYLKGYVRNIAKMVGLDADALAQVVDQQFDSELSTYLPQAPIAPPATGASSSTSVSPGSIENAKPAVTMTEQVPSRPSVAPEPEARQRFTPEPLTPPKPNKAGTLRSIAVLILLIGVLIGLLVQYQRMQVETPQAPPEPPAAAINATIPDNASIALDNASANASLPDTSSAETAATPAAPEPSASATPAAPVAPAPTSVNVPTASIEVSRSAPVVEMRTPGMQQLTITAKADEVCWIQVNDGQQAKSFTLRNGETRQVEFSRRLSVRLGNAGGVSFRLNDKDYPYEGKRGSIETVEFGAR
ncbi:MAG: helix-turn-helix domain-containing protein [Humidesulfovibrio sp.]|uniref:helix-turn-helix domain-containing protein n=1 Tax=Humidesulfovibrio sp. TaxID=2910988 RepID=UPI0027F245A4|nr:helix-turn-helix domain-containing protein [Humidesulfovibrio sp.]MDQ7834084.1 helix-turn-helix domain-containing protein [Humidesulfovibrio sp.]